MKNPRPTAVGKYSVLALALTATLVACGGGTVTPVAIELPVLGPATPASFSGDCTALPGVLASLPNTTITAANTVPAGNVANVATAE